MLRNTPDLAKSNKANADFDNHSHVDDDFKDVKSESRTTILE